MFFERFYYTADVNAKLSFFKLFRDVLDRYAHVKTVKIQNHTVPFVNDEINICYHGLLSPSFGCYMHGMYTQLVYQRGRLRIYIYIYIYNVVCNFDGSFASNVRLFALKIKYLMTRNKAIFLLVFSNYLFNEYYMITH